MPGIKYHPNAKTTVHIRKIINYQGAVGCRNCYNRYQAIRLSVVKYML